ncbi:MAG: hypothetical protein AABZ57_00110, partial [Candidatus Margulisiibacteriota bacterium]
MIKKFFIEKMRSSLSDDISRHVMTGRQMDGSMIDWIERNVVPFSRDFLSKECSDVDSFSSSFDRIF